MATNRFDPNTPTPAGFSWMQGASGAYGNPDLNTGRVDPSQFGSADAYHRAQNIYGNNLGPAFMSPDEQQMSKQWGADTRSALQQAFANMSGGNNMPYNYFGGGTGFQPPSMPPGQQYTGGNPMLGGGASGLPTQTPMGGFMPQPVAKPMSGLPQQQPIGGASGGFMPMPVQKPGYGSQPWNSGGAMQPPISTLPYKIPPGQLGTQFPGLNPGAPGNALGSGGLPSGGWPMTPNQTPNNSGMLQALLGRLQGAGAASPGMFGGGYNPFAGGGFQMGSRPALPPGAITSMDTRPAPGYSGGGFGTGRMYAGGSPGFNEMQSRGGPTLQQMYGRGVRQ